MGETSPRPAGPQPATGRRDPAPVTGGKGSAPVADVRSLMGGRGDGQAGGSDASVLLILLAAAVVILVVLASYSFAMTAFNH